MNPMRIAASLILLLASSRAFAAPSYDVDYTVEFLPAKGEAAVTIALDPGDGRATRLDFAMDAERYLDVAGDGFR